MTTTAWKALLQSTLPVMASYPSVHLLAHLRPRQLRGASVVEAIETLLGPMTRETALEVTRQIAVSEFRNRCLQRIKSRGDRDAVQPLIRIGEVESIGAALEKGRGVILIYWHLGPVTHVLGEVLERFGQPLLVANLTRHEVAEASGALEYVQVAEPEQRAYALKRAIEQLRAGEMVALALDGGHGERVVEAAFLGRRCQFSRGVATLARMSGAPIVPVVKTWSADAMIDVRTYEPLSASAPDPRDSDDVERRIIETAVRWFEEFHRANPGQIRVSALPALWHAEPFETGTAVAV